MAPLASLALALCAPALLTACGPPTGALDVRAYPAEQRANYALFEDRCSRCHDLVRPLGARVGEGGWQSYVRRMSRHPGAGIGVADQRAIAAFLEFHHHHRAAGAPEGTP
jgi:hypothetical protein